MTSLLRILVFSSRGRSFVVSTVTCWTVMRRKRWDRLKCLLPPQGGVSLDEMTASIRLMMKTLHMSVRSGGLLSSSCVCKFTR